MITTQIIPGWTPTYKLILQLTTSMTILIKNRWQPLCCENATAFLPLLCWLTTRLQGLCDVLLTWTIVHPDIPVECCSNSDPGHKKSLVRQYTHKMSFTLLRMGNHTLITQIERQSSWDPRVCLPETTILQDVYMSWPFKPLCSEFNGSSFPG
jgi:hypothetical protein